ncbi:dipeptidase [Sphingosinicella microcystinivorans]|uniref:dipeptidase n=1 Tax=Sphingosinicella microcystinivorans TaxID=335406 RepID=UPI0022F39E79|nr:membrane dipeptidase [Sphingosinicella microcystinivorans]WBX85956.1 membrane dipeptidase [Sphingosinicella microcystinivorans]
MTPTFNRRELLAVGGAGAALLAGGPSFAADKGVPRGAIVVNALGGLSNPNVERPEKTERSGWTSTDAVIDRRVIDDARASGLTAVNITIGHVFGPNAPFEQTVREIAHWDAVVRRHPADLLKVLTAEDILRANRENRIGIIYGFQNTTMLGEDASRADVFANLGVRIVQLTYNPANAVGDGSMAPENRGLTPFGREVVERLNANRVMVDLSHSGEKTCLEAARVSKQPISINHTGCRALTDLPRNKTDAELRLVAERGGFVGIYFMPFLNPTSKATADDVVAHIEHAVNVCGEDHVGIGTDGGITTIDDLGAYRAKIAKEIADRRAAGIGAKGENPDTLPFVIDLRGPSQFHDLADRLRRRGYSDARIEKILGLNFVAYAKAVWGA